MSLRDLGGEKKISLCLQGKVFALPTRNGFGEDWSLRSTSVEARWVAISLVTVSLVDYMHKPPVHSSHHTCPVSWTLSINFYWSDTLEVTEKSCEIKPWKIFEKILVDDFRHQNFRIWTFLVEVMANIVKKWGNFCIYNTIQWFCKLFTKMTISSWYRTGVVGGMHGWHEIQREGLKKSMEFSILLQNLWFLW